MPADPITSLTNPRVKRIVALRKGWRAKEAGVLIAEGSREIDRALSAGLVLQEGYALANARPADDRFTLVTDDVLAKMTYHREPEGAIALFQRPIWDWSSLGQGNILVAVDTDKPGNLGAMVRTASAAGLAGVIAAGQGVDVFNPNAIRASTGAVFDTPVIVAEEQQTIDWLRQASRPVFPAMVDASTHYRSLATQDNAVIVIGPEDRGLGPHWQDVAQDTGGAAIHIPMHQGVVDSLNASVAAGVLMFALAASDSTTQ